ncbi:MAG: HipA N-terminal domain-containing protein [Burkholderiaceae bacterium]|nr:HipA N-terminal domain-containing protein [Burkholderiaceae bacterium]
MTSKERVPECFVYITLPGQTEQVTAGRFVVTTDRTATPVGRFVYGRRYRERPDAVELDPVELKLSGQTYTTTALQGVFGVLRDAGPDYWGRRLIERHLGQTHLSELDYLLYSPDDRAGVVGFGLGQTPPAPRRDFNRTLDLDTLQTIADSIVRDEQNERDAQPLTAEQAHALLLIGHLNGWRSTKGCCTGQRRFMARQIQSH